MVRDHQIHPQRNGSKIDCSQGTPRLPGNTERHRLTINRELITRNAPFRSFGSRKVTGWHGRTTKQENTDRGGTEHSARAQAQRASAGTARGRRHSARAQAQRAGAGIDLSDNATSRFVALLRQFFKFFKLCVQFCYPVKYIRFSYRIGCFLFVG